MRAGIIVEKIYAITSATHIQAEILKVVNRE